MRQGLVKKQIVDKRGKRTSVWVRTNVPSLINKPKKNKQIKLKTNGSHGKKGIGEVKSDSIQVRYNGQDAIGNRSRTKSEKVVSRKRAKEKLGNPKTNAPLKAANDYVSSVGLPKVVAHKYKPSEKELQTELSNVFDELEGINSPTRQPHETKLERDIYQGYKEDYPDIIKSYNITGYKDLVRKSYDQLAFEVNKQFEQLPVKVSWHDGDKDYLNSSELLDDVHNFGHVWIFKGGEDHPMLGSVTKDKNGVTANDKFRAVHDYYGHGVEGYQFGKDGEENAWIEHCKMLSPLAQWALTAETRAQNSWVNYSGANEVALEKIKTSGALIKKGKSDGNDEMVNEGRRLLKEGQSEFKFAEQKSIIPPSKYANIVDYYDSGVSDMPKKLLRQ